jgi:hypothetical protein
MAVAKKYETAAGATDAHRQLSAATAGLPCLATVRGVRRVSSTTLLNRLHDISKFRRAAKADGQALEEPACPSACKG